SETVRNMRPEYALDLIRKLEPFVNHPVGDLPENLRAEIRGAYTSASRGLGQQGIKQGWDWAFRVLEQDLGRISRETNPDQWAIAATSLAEAKFQAGQQFGVNAPLEQAIALYLQINDIHTRERQPLQWAMTANDLGNALMTLGERESGTARLE